MNIARIEISQTEDGNDQCIIEPGNDGSLTIGIRVPRRLSWLHPDDAYQWDEVAIKLERADVARLQALLCNRE